MTDLSGITVTPGVLPEQLHASLETAVERIGARIADTVRIDTTHFVCTEGRGKDWERALEMNIPVVRPEWVEGCEREGRIVGVRGYYLDANPKQRQVGANPSISNPAPGSSSSNVMIGAKGSQANLPERRAPPPPPPPMPLSRSPDRESHVGEGDGPGPEIPPTPPPKNQRPRSPVSEETDSAEGRAAGSDVSEEEKEDEDEDQNKATEEEGEKAASSAREGGRGTELKRSEASMKAKVEYDHQGGERGTGDMDEVPL